MSVPLPALLTPSIHAQRRQDLMARLEGHPVLLMGNGTRASNLPMNTLPFRQDSSFLYFTGCDIPFAAAMIEGEGRCTLFLPTPSEGDALWHGPTPTMEAIGAALGVDEVRPDHELASSVSAGAAYTLAVGDEERNRLGARLTGAPLAFGAHPGHTPLIDAVIQMRRVKSADELRQMRSAAGHTIAAHEAVMRATRPGVSERALAALFRAVLDANGCDLGYGIILTQRGEVLHNFHHTGTLEEGRLLLLDGGGEVASGYGVDVTRTWPVSGTFSPRQASAYSAVLAAQDASIARCRPGVGYRDVHDASSLVIARFLADEGLITVSPEDAVAEGAHALFFPHGVGHHLGMDVHHLENFGDRPSYPEDRQRPAQFGTCYLRLDLPLEAGWVVTVEPGFYVVPAILDDPTLRARFASMVNFDRAAEWLGFGGIRIEDDLVITSGEPENLSGKAPKSIAELEATVGQGLDVGAALWGVG